ncbi:MAG: hypothetical protein JKY37_05095 [Nannocystaceae bacterium]|nr:hypothetical protein [Nannocystaceae bacterium]
MKRNSTRVLWAVVACAMSCADDNAMDDTGAESTESGTDAGSSASPQSEGGATTGSVGVDSGSTAAGSSASTVGATSSEASSSDSASDGSTTGAGSASAVTVTLVGDGFGSVTDGTSVCTESPCTFPVRSGGAISLTATARDGLNIFLDWSGACSGAGTDCDLMPDGDVELDAGFQLIGNVAFVASQAISIAEIDAGAPAAGTFYDKADQFCTDEAAAAGLHGTQFVAWVAGTGAGETLADRVGAARAWVRTDGRPVADAFSSMVDGSLLNPIVYDELGEHLPTVGFSGLDLDATPSESGGDCVGWSSTAGDESASAGAAESTRFWAGGLSVPCDGAYNLYCVGVDGTEPLADTLTATGRIAFMTSTGFDLSSGRAAADALCASEANGVLEGNFLAALATSEQQIEERFDLTGEIWVRPDGQPIVDDASQIASGQTFTSIHQTADGSDPPIFPLGRWTIAGVNCQDAPEACCEDWSTSGGNVQASARWGTPFAAATTGQCSASLPVVCLQE